MLRQGQMRHCLLPLRWRYVDFIPQLLLPVTQLGTNPGRLSLKNKLLILFVHAPGCRGDNHDSKLMRADTSPSARDIVSIFQSVGGKNDDEFTLAEYLVWVSRSQGVESLKNDTILDSWIQKFAS